MASEESVKQFREYFQQSRQAPNTENHFGSLGLTVIDIQSGWAIMRFDPSDHLIGNPVTGSFAAGPIFALLDSCCAMAAATCGEHIRLSPTLDLRVDFLGPVKPNLTVTAEAKAYRDSRFIVFTEGFAYQDNKEKPVARCTVNFTPINQPIIQSRSSSAGNSHAD